MIYFVTFPTNFCLNSDATDILAVTNSTQ